MPQGRHRLSDRAQQALEEAEHRAFEHYGLDVQTHFVELPDPPIRVRVLESGNGMPLVLIGGPSASAWAPLMAGLRRYRVLAVERPGCGLSDPFDYAGVDLRRHAVSFLSSLIDVMELGSPALAGNSLGGLWGFWMALDHPGSLPALAQLGCPAFLLGTSAPLSKRMLSVRGLNRVAPSPTGHSLSRLSGQADHDGLPPPMGECLYRASVMWGRGRTHLSLVGITLTLTGARIRLGEEELARVAQPVMFVWGDRDEYGPPEVGRRAGTILPDSGMVVLPAGHLPWLDRPSECAAALQAFLGSGREFPGSTKAVRDLSTPDGTARSHHDPAPPAPGTEIKWLHEVLWPAAKVGVAGAGPPSPRDGTRVYAVFPSPSNPLLLTPLATRAAASASLRRYNALRPRKRRLVRAALGAGLRLGLVQPVLRRRLWIQDGQPVAEGDDALQDRMCEVFDASQVVTSISLSRPGPFRMPVLQAMTPGGKVLGYVKVGWNDLTREMVRNEATALEVCGAARMKTISVPRLIHSGPVGPLEILVTAPLPPKILRHRLPDPSSTFPAMREVAELGGLEPASLADSVFWAVLRERVGIAAKVAPGRAADTIAAYVADLERTHGGESLAFGFWHGDWVPWNLGWADGKLYTWDWEHSRTNVPLGFDLIHLGFQVAFIAKRRTFTHAALESRTPGLQLLGAFGMAPAASQLVFRLYLLEAFLRYHEPSISGSAGAYRFDSDSAVRVLEESSTGPAVRA